MQRCQTPECKGVRHPNAKVSDTLWVPDTSKRTFLNAKVSGTLRVSDTYCAICMVVQCTAPAAAIRSSALTNLLR